MTICGRQIAALDKQLGSIIVKVEAEGLLETAALLRMAQLDLQTRIYGIAPEELDILLDVARHHPHGFALPQKVPLRAVQPAGI